MAVEDDQVRAQVAALRREQDALGEKVTGLGAAIGAIGDSVDDIEEWRSRVHVALSSFGEVVKVLADPRSSDTAG